MQSKKLSVLFYLSKAKVNTRGLAPLTCRITLDKKRKEFSTGYYVSEDNWDASKQLIISKSIELKTINSQLNQISQLLLQHFNNLLLQKSVFDVNDVYNLYKSNSDTTVTYLLEFYFDYLKRLEKLIGVEIKKATWKKHENAYSNLKGYIQSTYKGNDLKIQTIDLAFVKDYEFYLKTKRKLSQATINKVLQRFKKMLVYAIERNVIEHHPFIGYRFNLTKKQIVYLTTDELKSFENLKPVMPRLQLVKDLFVFCCYTGLAFNEMGNLSNSHIIKGFDGKYWISILREKTLKNVSIPLLPKAEVILKKYSSKENLIFPKISNQKFNAYIKELSEDALIDKVITHHTARKTFASTVLLYNDVPMEIVSELLGHSSIKVTQESYAKLSNRKVSETMKRLSTILK
ncbi:site-specific integrase [Flavobacterium sp. I3-2]|uniref:site-specific integrase n=1 Tax=Flavobacterium sp. I3-2 TaxID=2748319 RepID=UPI0015AADC53|nr:site-specific integrase [Flavobacterium sp. I3-2]